MNKSILIGDRVVMSLMWLGSENGLQLVGDVFGIAKIIVSIIVGKRKLLFFQVVMT
jgi:hypothetical protein